MRAKPCGKVRHRSQLSATRHAVKLMASGKADNAREYYCIPCRAWHITRQPFKDTKGY